MVKLLRNRSVMKLFSVNGQNESLRLDYLKLLKENYLIVTKTEICLSLI